MFNTTTTQILKLRQRPIKIASPITLFFDKLDDRTNTTNKRSLTPLTNPITANVN
jgi:hypothetical protein